MLVGFAAGIAVQVELLKPGIKFVNLSTWSQLVMLHALATPISLIVICLSTISLVRHRNTLGQWAIWLGFCTVPVLLGILMTVIAQPLGNTLTDTIYITTQRHAYGTAILLVALGGLSALSKIKLKTIPLKISFCFAFLITTSGVILTVMQARLSLIGMPRGYIDYPNEFALFQFYASVAAITCFCLSALYVILLWGHKIKK